MDSGFVFNIQRYSVQDGPGIRTTVFLKGCPLHCAWCHNPEGISPQPEIYFLETLCLRCGECRRACPHSSPNGAERGSDPLSPSVDGCELCGSCVEACPSQARRFAGKEMTVGEVLEAVLRDRVFFEESGGGVTFSGGEPLLQPAFLLALLEACRRQGVHTAVDTSGFGRTEHLLAIAPLVDLFLFDLKLSDEAAHRRFTGASNTLILRNLRALSQVHSAIWIRVPFVQGVNDSPSELTAIARLAAETKGVRQLMLLPFHRMGSQKFQRLGKTQPVNHFEAPSPEAVDQALTVCRQAGIAAQKG